MLGLSLLERGLMRECVSLKFARFHCNEFFFISKNVAQLGIKLFSLFIQRRFNCWQ